MSNGLSNILTEITLRGIPDSEAVEQRIRAKIEKLHQFFHHIESCKVVVEYAQKHQSQGRLFTMTLELEVPNKRLAVSHKKDEDLYVVIRDTFAAMKKQLDHYAGKNRKDVKTHATALKGKVVRLFDDYGFIEDPAGMEYYFSDVNVVRQGFAELIVGSDVSFIENPSGDALQANHVNLDKAA
ncbi:MAG: HPF/RaiA family ribosome-associated protein [Gammaproteobacteria bacterium]